MTDETNKEKANPLTLVYTRNPEFMLHFANSVQVSPGRVGEVQLFFGQVVAPPSGATFETLQVRQHTGIVLTISEAKSLLALMQKQIPVFETEIWATQKSDDGKRRIMIKCTETQKPVNTGLVTDKQTFENTVYNESIICPHCGRLHVWTKQDAYLEEAGP